MWGLFVGAAAAVLAPIGPGALVPLKLAVASADSVGNDVYVAVVVDFGNGSSMTTVSKCVPVASSAHDADALAAAVGSVNVAYSSSGLLCAIDNYPANGVQNCGESVGNGDYDYWSYWHGASGSWVYANNGPAEQSVSAPSDDVEGLRFQESEPASSSDPPPAVTPSYAQICNASTEVPPAQSSSTPATTTTTVGAATAPSVTPTVAKSNGGSVPVTTTTTPVGIGSKSAGGGATTTTTAASGGTSTTVAPTTSSGTAGGSHGSSDAHRIAAASAAAHGSTSGGSSNNLVPVVLIAVVVAALGAFALFRWRRRPAEE
jgi:hypothetical protein